MRLASMQACDSRRTEIAGLTALVFLFLALLFVTWQRWGDIVVDCGRDLYLAMRVADGDLLYRDITSQYPPLAPYINAALLRLFGVHLDVLYGAGIASAALLTWLTHRLARSALPVAPAAAISGLFLLKCGFGPFLYNFILPASYSGTYGLLCGLITLCCLLRAWERNSSTMVIVAGLFAGLAALCKLESGAAAVAAGVAFCIGVARARSAERVFDGLRFLGPAAIVLALCALWLASHGALGTAWSDNIFPMARVQYWNEQFFHTRVPSGAELARILFEGAWFVAAVLVFTIALAVAALVIPERLALQVVLAAAALAAAKVRPLQGAVAALGLTGLHWAPLGALGCLVWGVLKARESPPARVALLVGAFTLGLLARWGFAIHEYSREYSAPTLILIAGLLVHAVAVPVAAWASRWMRRGQAGIAAAWTTAVLVAAYGVAISDQVLALNWLRDHEVRTERGTIYTQPMVGRVFSEALQAIANLPAGEELLVIPEEGFLNFLSGRRSRTRYSTLIPGMLIGQAEEEGFIEHLYREGPRYLVLTERRYPEFGVQGFATYNPLVARWIQQNYLSVARFREADYGLELLVRSAKPRRSVR
jgi:hypothetical protein